MPAMGRIALCLCLGAATVLLTGCSTDSSEHPSGGGTTPRPHGGGSTTPRPTTTPHHTSTPPPTSTPQPPTPHTCTPKDKATNQTGDVLPCCDAACCKASAKLPEDGKVCDDFYDSSTGVAISMISLNAWAGKGGGSTGMDKGMFNEQPPDHIKKDAAQAISITHFQKAAWLYPGSSQYGVIYGLGPDTTFWKFFTTCPKDKGLCAQCTDGFKCPVESAPSVARQTLGDMPYEEFTKKKNAIVSQTGTSDCTNNQTHQYNEFDTNGLSSDDLGGVFAVKTGGAASRAPVPPDSDVCSFILKSKTKKQGPWPVYAYDAGEALSSLRIERYLECSGQVRAKEAEVDEGVASLLMSGVKYI